MSWDGIAQNQTVSCNNLQDAVNLGRFALKNAIPATNEQITKADADYYVYLNTGYGPYASKAANQLVVKSNLIPIGYNYEIFYEEPCYYDGFYVEGGAASSGAACLNGSQITLYSTASSFQNGIHLFYDSQCSNPWYGDAGACGNYYAYNNSGTLYSFSYPNWESVVSGLTICSGPPPSWDYYLADVYECGGCGHIDTMIVAFSAGSSVMIGKFYMAQSGPDGMAYQVTSNSSAGVAYILSTSWGAFPNCFVACSI